MKYSIDSTTLTGLADALRTVTGEERTYTPEEMIEAVTTILDAAVYILKDDAGNEVVGVLVENEVEFTATENDIRAGKIAATANGVTEGTKEIPAYLTSEGHRLIPSGSDFIVPSPYYEYTKLQAIFCPYNTSVDASVAADRVAISDKVYPVQSLEAEATVTFNDDGYIDFGLTNTSGSIYLLRYFTYKEE